MFRLRLINPEWFREPPSLLESTLRTPYILKHAAVLFLRRLAPIWFITSFAFWLISRSVLASSILGFVISVILELFFLKRYYETQALPKHLKNIERVKALFKQSKEATAKELVRIIDDSVRLSSWGLVNIAYVGLSAWGWEIIFKTLYPFITSSKISYQNLLVGFKNKVMESDQMLWEVAKEKDKARSKKKLEQFIDEYGSKVDDLEISKPTLREQPKVIDKLIDLYSNLDSPISLLKRQESNREKDTSRVLENIRISKGMFNALLKIVQKNVVLREDRRHYHFIVDYYIRMMIIGLGQKLFLSENEIFNISWESIRNKANKISK